MTNKLSQHTPTPWSITYVGTSKVAHILGPQGLPQCEIANVLTRDEEERENAAFIVRACNAHEALVEALTAFVNDDQIREQNPIIMNKAKQALAKVK